MARAKVFVAAVAVAVLGVLTASDWSEAQPAEQRALEACAASAGVGTIPAERLPRAVEPGSCNFGGRAIADRGGVGAAVPGRGMGVHVTAMTTRGEQELRVEHRQDGTVLISGVGDEAAGGAAPATTSAVRASGPSACRDGAYALLSHKVFGTFDWYYNAGTTPGEIGRFAALDSLRRAGKNIVNAENDCGLADGVSADLQYLGNTARGADIDANGNCAGSGVADQLSVVSFGDLPGQVNADGSGYITQGVTCTLYRIQNGPGAVVVSDLKLNSVEATWTTSADSPSCAGRKYGVESVATHERGHTFGLGHVSETYHGNLTMSAETNGPCQVSEQTLGLGDVRGMRRLY